MESVLGTNYVFFRCCELGCLSGAAVVQSMGAEINADGWTWVHAHMHEGRARSLVRGSAGAVQRELLACYELIESVGRGVVYYGSARLKASLFLFPYGQLE